LAQYASKFLWSIKDSESPESSAQIKQMQNFENTLMLRFGKCVEALTTSLNSLPLNDNFLRTTISLSRISNGLYLLCDNIDWLVRIGLLKWDEVRYAKMANNYWLYGVVLVLIKNLYQLQLIYYNHPRSFDTFHCDGSGSNMLDLYSYMKELSNFVCYNKGLTLEIVRDICDLCLSLNASEKYSFTPTTVGFAGVISSLIPILKCHSILF
ncbi:Peroxisomal membrane protein PMP30B, partial [Blomia tropicalis]